MNTQELLKGIFSVLQVFTAKTAASKLHNDVPAFVNRLYLELSTKTGTPGSSEK